jgi:hypothetical protein
MRSELQPVLELARSLPADRLPEFIGELESIKVVALARIQPAVDPDEEIDAQTIADRLGIARSTFYRNNKARPYPFVSTEGSKITGSAAGLRRYQQQKRR